MTKVNGFVLPHDNIAGRVINGMLQSSAVDKEKHCHPAAAEIASLPFVSIRLCRHSSRSSSSPVFLSTWRCRCPQRTSNQLTAQREGERERAKE